MNYNFHFKLKPRTRSHFYALTRLNHWVTWSSQVGVKQKWPLKFVCTSQLTFRRFIGPHKTRVKKKITVCQRLWSYGTTALYKCIIIISHVFDRRYEQRNPVDPKRRFPFNATHATYATNADDATTKTTQIKAIVASAACVRCVAYVAYIALDGNPA